MVKNPPANAGDAGSTAGLGRSPEKEMATHSSILAWEIPGQRSPMVFCPWCHKRVRHDLMTSNNIQPLLQEINIS